MANEKFLKGRFQQKIDIKENWDKAKNFVPLEGEIIVYKDLNKIKIGDGEKTVGELNFATGEQVGEITEKGGIVFGDYKNNDAGNFAVAFGGNTNAEGEYSMASGCSTPKIDAEYTLDENGKAIYDEKDYRKNESIGLASTAAGLGAVAYSMGSKSLGYRTQTGYPLNEEHITERPEVVKQTDENGNVIYPATDDLMGLAAVALGSDTAALGKNAISGGTRNIAKGNNSLATGLDSQANAGQTLVGGQRCIANVRNSIAFGLNNEANSVASTVFGYYNKSSDKVNGQAIVGSYNDYENGVIDNAIFVVGSGTGETNRRNALVVNKDGSVKIIGDVYSNDKLLATQENIKEYVSNIIHYNAEKDSLSFGNMVANATGNTSVAFGYYTNAIGQYSFAAGANSEARGQGSVALCGAVYAKGGYSLAAGGDNTEATGEYSIALGQGVKATNRAAFAAGARSGNIPTEASGIGSCAIGTGVLASGSGSFATGYETKTTERYSMVSGYKNEVPNSYAFATGNSNKTWNQAQAVFGQYNDYKNKVAADKAYLVVGNGTSDTERSNAFVVQADGDVTVAGALRVGGTTDDPNFFVGLVGNIQCGAGAVAGTRNTAAFGEGTWVTAQGGLACGKYNVLNNQVLLAVGNGTSGNRQNAFSVNEDGNVTVAGNVFVNNNKKLATEEYVDSITNGQYELIETITLTEDVASIVRKKDTAGQSYNFRAISVHISTPAANAKTSLGIHLYHDSTTLGYVNASGGLDTAAKQTICRMYNDHGLVEQYFATGNGASSANRFKAPRYHHVLWENITQINFSSGNAESAPIPAGTVITIYAIRG